LASFAQPVGDFAPLGCREGFSFEWIQVLEGATQFRQCSELQLTDALVRYAN
jgi:hypothetical protein